MSKIVLLFFFPKKAISTLMVCFVLCHLTVSAKMTFTITGGFFYDEANDKIVEASNAADSVLFQLVNLGANGTFDPVEAGSYVGGDDVIIGLSIDTNGTLGSAFSIGGTSNTIAGYFSRQFSVDVTSGIAEAGDAIGLRWWPALTVQDYKNGFMPTAQQSYGQVHLYQKYTYTTDSAYTAWLLPADTTTISFDPAVTSQLVNAYPSVGFVPSPEFTGTPDQKVIALEPTRTVSPNDTRYAQDQQGLISLGAEKAWYHTTGSADVVVAVIDTGIDMDHPDLLANLFTNTSESAFANGIDDDGNGYVDDRHGWDFVEGDNTPQDQNGHGTMMSGIIGAVGNNNLGISGVGWNCKILPLRCGVSTISEANVVSAIDYVITLKQAGVNIAAINLSYNDPSSLSPTTDTPLKQAMQRAQAAGILLIASAGNDSQDNDLNGSGQDYSYPADFENVIAVASIDANGLLASDSNFGATSIDLAAPGVQILSTQDGGGYQRGSGTSQAAAFVSGAAALIKAYNPDITYARLKRVLVGSVMVTPHLTGKVASNGQLDLERALLAAIQDKWMADNWGANWLDDSSAQWSKNPDNDSANTLEEFVLGTSPMLTSDVLLKKRRGFVKKEDGSYEYRFMLSPDAAIVKVSIETTNDLTNPDSWSTVPEDDIQFIEVDTASGFYQYRIEAGNTRPLFYRMVFENPAPLDF